MLFSIFNALGPISIPTSPTAALAEFFHADTVVSVHPLPVSWYLISSVCVYLCSCMHTISILCSTADAISSGSCPILFKVLTLNVAICSVCLLFSSFCCLSSVADFSNTEARAPTSAGRAPFLPMRRAMRFVYVVWVWVMVIFRWLFYSLLFWGRHSGVLNKTLLWGVEVSEFELQSLYDVLFRANAPAKGIKPLIPPQSMC